MNKIIELEKIIRETIKEEVVKFFTEVIEPDISYTDLYKKYMEDDIPYTWCSDFFESIERMFYSSSSESDFPLDEDVVENYFYEFLMNLLEEKFTKEKREELAKHELVETIKDIEERYKVDLVDCTFI